MNITKLIGVLFLLSNATLFAQQSGGVNFQKEIASRANIPEAPESAAFARYGEVPVNLYAGTPGINVAIYTHKGRELDLPISLSYDASGIKVSQTPTTVGLGWNLNVGGRITRMVNNRPDDYEYVLGYPYKSWYSSSVFNDIDTYSQNEYRFGTNSGGSKVYSSYASAKNYLEFLEKVHYRMYETQPDLYSINVMGLQETFVLDLQTKTPIPLNNPNIKITTSTVGNANSGGINTFNVTSDNGTKYTFTAVESTETLDDSGQEWYDVFKTKYKSAWYLSQVVSSTGKDTYTFEYETIVDHRNTAVYTGTVEAVTILRDDPDDSTTSWIGQNTTTTFYNRKALSKILHNGKVIVDATNTNTFGNGPDVALTNLSIYSEGTSSNGTNLLRSFDFNYSYFKNGAGTAVSIQNKGDLRLKLDGVDIKDASNQVVNDYTFDYINPDSMPRLSSKAQDYLGYYNGKNSNTVLYPKSGGAYYPQSDFSIGATFPGWGNDGANRGAVFSHMKKGTLNKITYPTGGYSTFEYEQAQVFENGNQEPRSGMRIKQIENYAENSVLTTRKNYEYLDAVALTRPVMEYITSEIFEHPQSLPYNVLHRMSQAVNADKQHVAYTKVKEIIVDPSNAANNLEKIYEYNAANDDGVYTGMYEIPMSGGNYVGKQYSTNPAIGTMTKESTNISVTTNTYNDRVAHDETWGLGIGIIGLNNNKYPVITEISPGQFQIQMTIGQLYDCINCSYDQQLPFGPPNECNGEPTCRPELSRIALYKIGAYGYHGGDVDQSISVKDGVTTTTDYNYTAGDRRYPSIVESTNSNGNHNRTSYTYPFNGGGGYSSLVNANMLSSPVKVLSRPDGAIGSTVKTEYSGLNPSRILASKGFDTLEERMVFEQYDSDDNLLQARQTDGVPISFIWGYNNRYVVAKITNVEYNNLPTSLINTIKSQSDSGNQAGLLTSLASLQNHASVADAQMTYYTYKPNIGVTTMTDVSGYRMTYVYDDFQRLKHVEDQDGNILSENEYNYKN